MNYTEINQTGWPLLLTLQLLPLLAGFAILRLKSSMAISIAMLVSLIEIILSISLYQQFIAEMGTGHHFLFAEQFTFWGSVVYHVGADGMSVLFILLTTIITPLTMFFALLRKQSSVLGVTLLVEAILISQFVSLDMLWFWLMSILEVGLIVYITQRWAHDWNSGPMIKRFFQFMLAGLILTGMGIFMLAWLYSDQLGQGRWSFNLLELQKLELPIALEHIIFFLLFYGISVRIPLFPVHGWLPSFLEKGSIAAPALFLGIKVGILALLRFVIPLTPNAILSWQYIIIAVAVLGIFYAALLAIQQSNLRRALAYAVISHTSIVVIALFTLNEPGFNSSLLLSIGFGFAIAGLFWITGIIRERTDTMKISELGNLIEGLGKIGPLIAISFVGGSLTLIGMPGTPGFEGMHLMLEASIQRFGALVTILAALGNVLAAGFILLVFQRIFLGANQTKNTPAAKQTQTHSLEIVIALSIILLTLIMGLYPNPSLTLIAHTIQPLADIYAQQPLHTGH